MSNPADSVSLANPGDKVIEYPRFKELYDYILMCKTLSEEMGEANCMVLEGCTGAGKTTLAKTFASAFARREDEFGVAIPVLYTETPSPVTEKSLAARLLNCFGDPGATRSPLWAIDQRLREYMVRCSVDLVILDDFQHFLDSRGNAIAIASDWLKVLIKDCNVPFLIVGQEGQVEAILQSNPQLSRLFAVRENLSPFLNRNKEEKQEFAKFVKLAVKNTGLEFDESLQIGELIYRIYQATNGVVANVVNLLHTAAYLAREAETPENRIEPVKLSLLSLERAFDLRLQKHTGRKNPFREPPNRGSRVS
jgi:ABC-type dipeptide/oligopeptide/nickel transport system ATPase subunit